MPHSKNEIRVLFIGDIFSKKGVLAVETIVPQLIEDEKNRKIEKEKLDVKIQSESCIKTLIENKDKTITVKTMATAFGVKSDKIRRLTKTKDFPKRVELGTRQLMFDRLEIVDFFNQRLENV